MKLQRFICGVFLLLAAFSAGHAAATCAPLLDHSFPALLTGKPQSLCQYGGKVLLVVNTASACGFTPQYEGLEALYKRYAARGLVVVGFPSNDFGGQEPGSNKEVADFCQVNYGVSFPMFEKTAVSGPRANPLYVSLAQQGGGAPQWNFHKYLIAPDGKTVYGFRSAVEPDSPESMKRLKPMLK